MNFQLITASTKPEQPEIKQASKDHTAKTNKNTENSSKIQTATSNKNPCFKQVHKRLKDLKWNAEIKNP